MTIRRLAFVSIGVCLLSGPVTQGQDNRYRAGHSMHGPAFDEGPREKPTRLDGIGRTHFPITTRHADVQAWFDQGHTLLHSYWFYDDFEEMPIHSTLLIDRQGRIHWGRHGGDPFDDVTFLQAQLRRMNQRQAGAPPTDSR